MDGNVRLEGKEEEESKRKGARTRIKQKDFANIDESGFRCTDFDIWMVSRAGIKCNKNSSVFEMR